MKKIAFFVEGQTEQLFINKLLREIAGHKNIAITLYQLIGGNKIPQREIIVSDTYPNPVNPNYEALIYWSGSDKKVKSDILDNMANLVAKGYSEIIGIRDLFPLTDLARLERGIQFIPPHKRPLPLPMNIIIAVDEIEAWFMAECTHFQCIDPNLTRQLIIQNQGYDPCTDDMTLLSNPVVDLHQIYKLVGKAYTKKYKHAERTVECLDYGAVYLNLGARIPQLNDLISKIDHFLT